MANDYWVKKLSALVGGKIVTVIVDDNKDDEFAMTDEPFIGLRVEMPGGALKDIWLLSDEEGNAPGRFDITNVK